MIAKDFNTYLILFILIAMAITFAASWKFRSKLVSTSFNVDTYYYFKSFLLFIILAFYSLYFSMIPMWEEFTYQDHSMFFSTLKDGNQHYYNPIWYNVGRFFPLAHQEFTYIAKVSASNFAYHIFSIFEIILISFISIRAFGKYRGLLFFIIISITPEFVQTYFGLIYPERNMVVLMLFSLVMASESIKQQSIFKLSASVLSACLFLFYKETSFLITAGIASSFLLSYFINRENKFALIASFSFYVISAMWLMSYMIDVYPKIDNAYGGARAGILESVGLLFSSAWFYLSCISFIYFICKQRKSLYILLPLVSIGYSLTMYIMNFKMPYYHLPSCVISIFCIFVNASHQKSRNEIIMLLIPAFITAIFIPNSIDIVKSRKDIIVAKADAADFIYKSNYLHGNKEITISFNNSNDNAAHLLSGYIENKYKLKVNKIMGGDCNGSDYALYLNKKPSTTEKYYTSSSVPVWESKYKVYALKCK